MECTEHVNNIRLKQCRFVHYSNVHLELVFEVTSLPYSDEYDDYQYYLICYDKCERCGAKMGPLTLTGPSAGFR
jgi:hypothetical protein